MARAVCRRTPGRNAQTQPENIDDYIARFPRDVQRVLQGVRRAIRAAAPGADEAIKYGVPTFVLNGNLVHFAGFKQHIGFYPTPSGIAKFRQELSSYPSAKGSVQFPLDEPMPLDLITRIVTFRVGEARAKVKAPPATGRRRAVRAR